MQSLAIFWWLASKTVFVKCFFIKDELELEISRDLYLSLNFYC